MSKNIVGVSKVSSKPAFQFPTSERVASQAKAVAEAKAEKLKQSTIPLSDLATTQFEDSAKEFSALPLMTVFFYNLDGQEQNVQDHKQYFVKVGNTTAIGASATSFYDKTPFTDPINIIQNASHLTKVRLSKKCRVTVVRSIYSSK